MEEFLFVRESGCSTIIRKKKNQGDNADCLGHPTFKILAGISFNGLDTYSSHRKATVLGLQTIPVHTVSILLLFLEVNIAAC